jgi:hypothetical protein
LSLSLSIDTSAIVSHQFHGTQPELNQNSSEHLGIHSCTSTERLYLCSLLLLIHPSELVLLKNE